MTRAERVPVFGADGAAVRARITFTFDGRAYAGLEGDSLAAALLANGVDIVGRSFKLHRPRGIMGRHVEEPNALMQLETGGFAEPNVRATMMPLYEGLRASGQNAWPNVRRDLLGVLDAFSALLPASFYYKSMMWPNWRFFERFVRPVAGLGKAPSEPDAQTYQKRNAHCDVLIVGGGPAGLSAALAASAAGLRVMLCDDDDRFGGTLRGERFQIDGEPAPVWIGRAVAQLAAMPDVQLLPRTSVAGYYENNVLVASERVACHRGPQGQRGNLRERLWRIRARTVILATGALERPMVFANNDRPGVMLASAVRTYANRYGVVPGSKVVVLTNHDNAYRTALDLRELGVREITVVDTRAAVTPELSQSMQDAGIDHLPGYGVADVVGRRKVRAVRIARHIGNGELRGDAQTLDCDLVAMSGGWTPTLHLYSQAGGALRYDDARVCLLPASCAQQLAVIGAANGDFSLPDCLEAGLRAGLQAARALGKDSPAEPAPPATHAALHEPFRIEPYWYTRSARTDRQWLDFQYDVKVSDIELAMRENYISVEHVKRYTTGGMSVDQGKSSNFNILAIMAELSRQPVDRVGTTRFRPPYQPVTLGAFAGHTVGALYAPWQMLPAVEAHTAAAAHFGDYGWRRPDCYLQGSESIVDATRREVMAVRNSVGMFDGSPLGKIEVSGPDAAVFLNRLYVNNLVSLAPGAARYAVLTNENGVLVDDGVVVRLAADHFLVHATSAAVGRVFLHFEEQLQCEWPDLRVHVANVTTQWANVTVSGPKARDVMQQFDSDIDFTPQAFPHMQARTGMLEGVDTRVLRASFTGEATYEISVPSRYGRALWDRVAQTGKPFGIVPYGIEALEVMRIEKGYLHIGTDTDGTTTPLDIGLGCLIEKKADDFIGRRSLQRPADAGPDRLQFVGLEALDAAAPLSVGGHFVDTYVAGQPSRSHGYVTSSCVSPTLGKSIGLGILRNGATRLGETVTIYANGKLSRARVVPAAHFDAKGERVNG